MPLFFSVIAVLIFFLIPSWVIFKKVGMSPALSLISLIPGIGVLIVVLILAFGDWPVHQPHMTN